MPQIDITPLPPAEAIRFFESKGFQVGFNWQDVWGEEHARAFTVAKVMRLDVLQDVRQAVDLALRDGITLQQFRSNLTPILQAKGWWGVQKVLDPKTGKFVSAQLGSPWRLNTIFDVNMRAARAAGRWAKIQRLKARRPFLFYSHVKDGKARPQHAEWGNLPVILRVDDPWWDTHYPPNGFRCRCIVVQLSQRKMDKRGLKLTVDPPTIDTRPFTNKRTGEVLHVPVGIDPGFNYNVGKFHMRGLVPPPRSGPLSVPTINPAASVAMPAVRQALASRLLPKATTETAAIDAFLNEFGTARGKAVVFTDKLGEGLVISESLFFTTAGRAKLVQSSRRQSIKLLADTIRDPDEIWWYWENIEKTGEYQLKRRYLARWEIDGVKVPIISVFDIGPDGWQGLTGFRSSSQNNLLKQRRGTLAWRRG